VASARIGVMTQTAAPAAPLNRRLRQRGRRRTDGRATRVLYGRPPPRQSRGLAVVLGGGAMLGAFEIGVIDVLAGRGVRPDLLIGTSVGAINAAYWAFHPEPEAGTRLLELWLHADRRALFWDGWPRALARVLNRQDHLVGHGRLQQLVRATFSDWSQIEDSQIPLALVATTLDTGERMVLRRGRLTPALLASTALPGLFPPVQIEGRALIDGGVVANVDVEAAVEAGMSEALVVDVMGTGLSSRPGNIRSMVDHTIGLSLRRQTDLALQAINGRLKVTLLRPELAFSPSLADASHTQELFGLGRVMAQAYLSRHVNQWDEYAFPRHPAVSTSGEHRRLFQPSKNGHLWPDSDERTWTAIDAVFDRPVARTVDGDAGMAAERDCRFRAVAVGWPSRVVDVLRSLPGWLLSTSIRVGTGVGGSRAEYKPGRVGRHLGQAFPLPPRDQRP
jgi:NTE family protein